MTNTGHGKRAEPYRLVPVASKVHPEVRRIIAEEAREFGVTLSVRLRDILDDHAKRSASSRGNRSKEAVQEGPEDEDDGIVDECDCLFELDNCAADEEHEECSDSRPLPHEKRTRRDSQT